MLNNLKGMGPMQTEKGTQGLSPLLKYLFKSFLLFLPLFLFNNQAMALTKFLVIAPGQSYDGSSAPNRYNPLTQVAGEQFTIDVFCYDDSDNLPRSSSTFQTQLSSPATATFNPSGLFDLPDTYAGVARSRRTGITVILEPSSNSNVAIDVAAAGGIGADMTQVYVQRIHHFTFTTLPAFTAGTANTIVIEARDASNNLCDAFNGTANLYALDAGVDGATVNLGTITFSNGVYSGTHTFYHATQYAQFRVYKSNSPAVDTYAGFVINAASFTRLLMIGPGQSVRSGENGGNGRAAQSTTTTAQTAGVNFTLTVYATDDYWNTRTANSTVTLTSEDPAFPPGGQSAGFNNTSSVVFNSVNLHTVGDGYVLMTASDSGSALPSTDDVPLNPAGLNNFVIANISSTTAGAGITIDVTGYDVYGNTVSSVSGTTDLQVLEGGTTPLSNANEAWLLTPAISSSQFSGDGNYTGTLNIRKAGNNYVVRITSTAIGDTDSNYFNISAASDMRYIVVMPGQTYRPGERFGGTWGRDGSAIAQQAGAAFNVSVVATDGYGNQVSRDETLNAWSGTTDLTVSDSSASVSPNPIVLTAGSAYPAFTLTVATTTQDLSVSGALFTTSSGTFTVYHTELDHFAISAGTAQTAGNAFSTVITAEDQYYNAVTTYAGTVYVTCPELDYNAPTESVLLIPAGTPGYTQSSTTAFWTLTGFSAGQRSFNTTVYRATTGTATATLFVSDNQNDRPSSYSGHIGQTAGITIAPNIYTKMFCIVPGLEHRPGGIDSSGTGLFAGNGYEGTPLSQQAGTAFSITVYATDDYWNVITTSNDSFTPSSTPSSSTFDDGGEHYASGTHTFSLVAGEKQLNVEFTVDANYTITIDNPGTITDYTTPYNIISFTLFKFTIEPDPVPTVWTAGVPEVVTITAYENETTKAITFNGSASLECPTLDYNSTLQVISPQSITFTNGVWIGEVTIYRASNENNTFHVVGGGANSGSTTFKVCHNTDDKLLIIESGGMDWYPGIAPDIDPTDEFGIQGQPAVQKAGEAITKIEFMLCDSYWNKITSTAAANGSINISSSDPYPAEIKTVGSLPLTVNLTNGVYTADGSSNGFTLYTVNGTSGQSITLSDSAGHTSYILGVQKNRVPVKHAEPGEGFQFIVDPSIISNGAVAGVPFAVTVAAIDAYGNTLDSINGATAFSTYSSVALSAQTDGGGNKSIWPTELGTLEATRWQEGVSYPWVYCYRQSPGLQFLTATYDFGSGNRTGTSPTFTVSTNTYARLVPIVTGMSTPDAPGAGGTYAGTYTSSPPPASASVFNNFGSPSQHTAGDTVSLQAYTCDIYGNVVKYPAVTVSMSSTDPYAPNAQNAAVVPTNGYADFSGSGFRFHTQGTATITVVDEDVTTTTAGTTPWISVVPGAFYGVQILVPGLVAIEGSGNTNVSGVSPVGSGGWYSGVTPTDPAQALNIYNGSAQFAGAYFPVTVQAVDMYGNFVNSAPNDTIELYSDDINSNAEPWVSGSMTSALSGGRAYFFCQQRTEGPRYLKPYDTTDSNIKDGDTPDNSWAITRVVQETDVAFWVYVEGILASDNQPVHVEAAPNTFNIRVEIRYTGTGEIVSSTQTFLMEPSLTTGTYSPANGTLGLTTGQTTYGYADITGQTYNRAETIYIRVRNASGSDDPDPSYSPEVRVRASAPASIVLTADTTSYTQNGQVYYQIQANDNTQVNAQVYDVNNNVVSGAEVAFRILDQSLTSSTLSAPEQLTTDTNGLAYTTFYAGAQNLEHTIRATVGTISADLIIFVTVTRDGGVYPNPFNPLRGQVVHIDYTLEADAPVKIEIYTLMGDLVWTKELAAGDRNGGHKGVNSVAWNGKNNNGVTVANGGYICVIKANDQEKNRFKIGVYKEK